MPYIGYIAPAMPYHLDGTVVKQLDATLGVRKTYSASEMLEMNDEDYTAVIGLASTYVIFFFPELVDITAIFAIMRTSGYDDIVAPQLIEWSANTTNGLDGTWTAAGMPNGYNAITMNFDSWRKNFKPMAGVTGAIALRIWAVGRFSSEIDDVLTVHLYGKKTAGQTPNDILFLNAEVGDMEFPVPLEFGDLRTNTFLVHEIKVKNSSATLTANAIVLTVLDPSAHITISVDNVNYGTTQNVGNLAPGASSVVYYVKCSLGVAPQPLGPDRAPISAEVTGGWS